MQAEEPLQVQVIASPASVSAGSSAQILVTVTYYGQPMSGATVVANTNTGSATLTPSSGSTDSSGKAIFRLDTTSSTSGTVRVSATVTKQTIDAYYAGNGYVDIPVQPVVFVPLEPVVLVSTTTPIPQPYQPPAAPPYQPPAAPPYQPYQLPAPQQPLPAGAQAPVAVISVDNYAGNIPLTVTFDGQQSYAPGGSIVSYAWNFGDGSTGTGYIAQHTYSAPGTFTASLVVTDNNGLSSNPATTQIIAQSTVQVQQQPVIQPPKQQQVYQPPPEQPVKKSEAAPLPMSAIEPGQPCDDGNKCTVDDYYDCTKKCVAGRNLSCDDSNDYTLDTCDPSVGCVHPSMAKVLDDMLSSNKCSGHSNFISINGEDIDQNSEIRVPVEGCNVKNLLLMTLNVDYNYVKQTGGDSNEYRNVLQFKRAEKGSLNDDAGFDAHQSHIADGKNTNDRISITFSSPSTSGYSGSGSIAVLVFDVIGGSRNITFITPTITSATDISNHPIPDTTLGGTFIVREWKGSGKVTTNNGRVTTEDALKALEMASGKRTVDLHLDMNNDAKVDAADVSILQKIATGERQPNLEQIPATAQGQISAKDREIINLINTEQEKNAIAKKINGVNHAFDVDLDAILASAPKTVSGTGSKLSFATGLPGLTGSSLIAQKSPSLLLSHPKIKNPATACIPPKIISVKSSTTIASGLYKPADTDYVSEDSVATIEGLNLGSCRLQDCGIYLEYPPGEVEFTKYYYDKTNGQLTDTSTHQTIAPNKFAQLHLLPYTGNWQDSWFDDGIVVKIPPISRESDMYANGPRFATLVVPIWPNGSTPMCLAGKYGTPQNGGGFQCTNYENQTVLRYPVWLNVDMAGISTIYSNPDYSGMLTANPHLDYWRKPNLYIPMYPGDPYVYGSGIIVSGGDLLITGNNFGNDTGKIKIVFPEPLIPYVNTTRPTWYESAPGQPKEYPDEKWLPGDPIPELLIPSDNITWSDNAIKLTVPKVHGSYDVTPGYLYIQKAHAPDPNLWSWTPVSFSPRWVWQQISGEGFFVGDFMNYGSSDNIYQNVNHVLIVSHSKDCAKGACDITATDIFTLGMSAVSSGDWGVDTIFKERPLPPNVKLLFFDFYQFDPNISITDQLEKAYDFLSAFYDDPASMTLKGLGMMLVQFIDYKTGWYGSEIFGPTPSFSPEAPVNPDQPWIVEQHLVKPTDPAIHIEWHTTCFSSSEDCGKPVRYAVTFYVRAPEDVDLRDSEDIIAGPSGVGAAPPALVFPGVKTT